MKPPLSYVPALPAAVGMIIGILLSTLTGEYLAISAAGIILWGILFFVKQHYLSGYALMCAVGAIMMWAHEPTPAPEYAFEGKHTFLAIIDKTTVSASSTSYVGTVREIDSIRQFPAFKCVITTYSAGDEMAPGTTVIISGRLRPLDTDTEVPYEVDYSQRFRTEGAVASYSTSFPLTEVKAPKGLELMIHKFRKEAYNAIVCSPVSGPTASFLTAAILGDRSLLMPADFESYRSTGVSHILALSGLHVGIVAGLLVIILFPFRFLGLTKRWTDVLVVVLIWGYAMITGMGPSIVRASVMITVFVAARMIQRGPNAYNSLLLSVVVILCINPLWLYSAGFQMSVSAVASLLMFTPIVPLKLKRKPLLYFSLSMIVVPIAAMLGTGIVSIYYFNMFPGAFLLSNIVAGLLFPWILGGGIILAFFTWLGCNFLLLGKAVDLLFAVMDSIVGFMAGADTAQVKNIYLSGWEILPYGIGLILLGFAVAKRRRWMVISGVAFIVLSFAANLLTRPEGREVEMYIPHGTPTRIIVKDGHKAWLYYAASDSATIAHETAACNQRYHKYLLSRECSTEFDVLDVSKRSKHIAYVPEVGLYVADTTIYIIDNNRISLPSRRAQYALVTENFTGHISDILSKTYVDTLLFSSAIRYNRRARFIRECGDTIAYKDLSKKRFKITR